MRRISALLLGVFSVLSVLNADLALAVPRTLPGHWRRGDPRMDAAW